MTDRRSFLQLAGAGSATLWVVPELTHAGIPGGVTGAAAGVTGAAASATADATSSAATTQAGPSLAPLLAAGLDPFATYCRMFASTTDGAECAWWFMGALPMQVEGIGPVDYVQEETIRMFRVAVPAPGQLDILWREVGVFRDIVTGEVPNGWFNPVKGAVQPQNGVLKGGPSHTRVRKAGDGVELSVDMKNTSASQLTLDGSIAGDRVCLTHVEDKSRAGARGAPPVLLRTVFKLYASLAELRGSAPSVAASGFYGVRNLGTGQVFVNGLTYKGRMDEQVNPLAWARIKAKEPGFFDGERLAPKWDDAG